MKKKKNTYKNVKENWQMREDVGIRCMAAYQVQFTFFASRSVLYLASSSSLAATVDSERGNGVISTQGKATVYDSP